MIVAVDADARRHGIRRGHTVAAARALCAGLENRPHDPEEDGRLLENLARALFAFTPDVCLDQRVRAPGTGGLLLEIGRTAFHFGGEEEMVLRIRAAIRELGHQSLGAVAPHPAAARAVALVYGNAPIRLAGSDLGAVLRELPWWAIEPDREIGETVRLLGLRTLGDLFALPRSGVAARLGDDVAETLDRILGRREELPLRIRPLEGFRQAVEWWPPTGETSTLVFAAKRLFDLAEAVLAGAERASVEMEVTFRMISPVSAAEREHATWILRPSRPTRSAATFLNLLGLKLENERLGGPVERLELAFSQTVALLPEQGGLFSSESDLAWRDASLQLLDRLSYRLGEERVFLPSLVADHRPEYAVRWSRPDTADPGQVGDVRFGERRPLLLEQPPTPLEVEADPHGRPLRLVGPRAERLRIARGPERIESGWWDHDDARRRYFEVETDSGARLWIYQDLKTERWYRHGRFD